MGREALVAGFGDGVEERNRILNIKIEIPYVFPLRFFYLHSFVIAHFKTNF